MNLPQLYYFRKLAELQHYTNAAKELFITQPTLSNSIASLERELGIPLFEREGRHVRLTRYGKEFYEHALEAINALERGIALAKEHAGSPTGNVDVGTIYTIQGDYLPALISAYRAQYGQGASVNVCQGLSLPLIEDLESDRYEVVFCAQVENKPDLTFVPVLAQRLVAVVHRYHKLAWRPQLSLSDLRDASPIITYPETTPIGKEVSELLRTHGVTPSMPVCNDEITLASMVDSTEGAVGVALDTLGLRPFRELITKRFVEVEDDFHKVCLAYKTGAYKTRATENFIEFARRFEWPCS
ncbi:LysR family transcriptional regulator [Rubneribacter badeniensis]|uniref:LysR family transcriptional regulator n=1 Tax=Rubneribacter badeniensis TaxID=2070688 RepID=A0A2K2U815_9ACTN|nr:LysR family transcriptional regulator [Rubneribacter badeniensis]PNV66461.1 LysR family transcriptional regulator [Rubneribacter badeniensis]